MYYVFAEIGIDMRGVLQLSSRLESAETFPIQTLYRTEEYPSERLLLVQLVQHTLNMQTKPYLQVPMVKGWRVRISLPVMFSLRLHSV